ncbi:blue copper protein-like [Olea europaea var. sylvestris]|uniref:blue copper protein-like n=1 Tax=Olea europaea var. sylvestris TaxID=158386 RepID=UPI000C1CFE38|nr:blue copper protein-like [Olea europaea var. sylvestris]
MHLTSCGWHAFKAVSFPAKALAFFFLMMALALFRTSMAAVYQVGDSAVFNYNPQLHNVLQVSKSDYQTCTTSAPIATFNTGSDSILLQTSGNHYYICAFHCQSGMKVPIEVPPGGNPSPPANDPSTPVNNPSPPENNPDTPTNPGFRGYIYPPPYLQGYDPKWSYGGSSSLSSGKLGLLIGVVSRLLVFYLY